MPSIAVQTLPQIRQGGRLLMAVEMYEPAESLCDIRESAELASRPHFFFILVCLSWHLVAGSKRQVSPSFYAFPCQSSFYYFSIPIQHHPLRFAQTSPGNTSSHPLSLARHLPGCRVRKLDSLELYNVFSGMGCFSRAVYWIAFHRICRTRWYLYFTI
jgi:hypothetical protein